MKEARIKEEKERIEVINSLSTIYSTIFQANIRTHEYEVLSSIPLMEKIIEKKGNFDKIKNAVITTFIGEEYKKLVSEFLDLNTLSSRLDKTNTIVIDYKDPDNRWMQARFIVKSRLKTGKAIEVLYVAHDITEEKNTKYQADHDFLTGLLNRGSFEQILTSIDTTKNNFALIIMDVDKFKDVNDTYGHEIGDKILKKVSRLLAENFRSIDHVCRIGGDEFAIIMTDVTIDLAKSIEDKILKINSILSREHKMLPPVSLSVGIAFNDLNNSKNNLFNNADNALYYVKKHGRNGCHIYNGTEDTNK